MISDDIQERLTNFIMLNAYDDKYIDCKEERTILQEAVNLGASVDEGIVAISQIAQAKEIVLERNVENTVMEMLRVFVSGDGKIDKKEFFDSVDAYKVKCQSHVPENEIKQRVKQMIQSQGWNVKEGGFFGSKWFSEI